MNIAKNLFSVSILAASLALSAISLFSVREAHADDVSGGTICGSSSCYGGSSGINYVCVNQGCGSCSVGNQTWCAQKGGGDVPIDDAPDGN